MLPTMYATRNQGFIPTLFNDIFNDSWMPARFTNNTPAVNVTEDTKEFCLEVAAPGMTKNDFRINLDGDNLVISMEKKMQNEDKDDKKYLRREFGYSKFQQTFTLPETVDRKQIAASMNDGVLIINLPKMTEEEKAQQMQYIEIQ